MTRKRDILFSYFGVLILSLSISKAVVAQGAPTREAQTTEKALLLQIERLSAKISQLEKKAAHIQDESFSDKKYRQIMDRLRAQEKGDYIAGSLKDIPRTRFAKEYRVGGYVDTSFTFNFNQPHSNTNAARSFDTPSNGFNLNTVRLELEREAKPFGCVVALDFGKNAELLGDAGLERTNNEISITMGYLDWKPPLETWFNLKDQELLLKLGKYQDLTGFENIESPSNWNFSAGLLNLFITPNTLLGARAQYNYKTWAEIYTGVFNGYDLDRDNNQAKTLEWGVKWVPHDKFNVFGDGIVGAEQPNKSGNHRGLFDLQAELHPIENLALRFNHEWGEEQNAVTRNKSAVFSGYAAYARYEWTRWYASAARMEFFNDTSGAKTGTAQGIREITLTNEFRFYKNLLSRLEYRRDWSSANIFGKSERLVDDQDTIALEAIFLF